MDTDNTDTGIEIKEEKTKILIAYHAHCIDGFTSAWACWKGLTDMRRVEPEDIELMPVTYGKMEDILLIAANYSKIYFVDFSVDLNTLPGITSQTEVVIIDHHKSAFEKYAEEFLNESEVCNNMTRFNWVSDNLHLIFDLEECGASLVWEHFFYTTKRIPKLIEYVKDYDIWQFKLSGTKALNKYLRLQKQTITNWSSLQELFQNPPDRRYCATKGQAMLDYHNSIVDQLVEQAEPVTIMGRSGLVVNCSPQFSSDVGHVLATFCGSFGATWQQEPDGVVKWSLRSNGDWDVSELASIFGGGGHKNAAGFTIANPEYSPEKGMTLWVEK